jgi:hypothetical protein
VAYFSCPYPLPHWCESGAQVRGNVEPIFDARQHVASLLARTRATDAMSS